MENVWEAIKLFVLSHKTVSIAVASAVGVSAVGAGGYGIYNHVTAEEAAEVVEFVDDYEAENITIPEFKSVVITNESLEKDLTIYISDENDNLITGVPFQVKLMSTEAAASLQSYVDAIDEIDTQISEHISNYSNLNNNATDYVEDEYVDDSALPVDGMEIDFSKSNNSDTEDNTEEGDVLSSDVTDILDSTSEDEIIMDILRDRNVDVTITDDEGNIIDVQHGEISSDPLYMLVLDKETALQSYTVALNEIEGLVFTDEDEDGIIAESDLEPGDYALCLINSLDSDISYEPTNFTTEANVKDKVEFVVQKEITKQIKQDVASEDGQKVEAVPVEETLSNTIEYVESKKEESGTSYKETTDVVAPTSTVSSSKATKKDGGVTSVAHDVIKTTRLWIKNNLAVALFDRPILGNNIIMTATLDGADSTSDENTNDENASDNTDSSQNNSNTDDSSSNDNSNNNDTQENTKKTYTITIKYVDADGNKLAEPENKTVTESDTYSYDAKSIDGYTLTSTSPVSGTASADTTITFTYKKNATSTTTKETASLDMSYSAGVFTITASSNVSNVKINNADITITSGKGTYNATADGEYKLTGKATFTDGYTDSSLSVTYTVSGYGTSTTEKLKDSKGNQLYLDNEGKTEATAADYVAGKTYYYKDASYTYYGWQSIDGNTYYFDKNGGKVTGTQVIQGVTYEFGADGVLVVKGTGIDVSKYQGKIDWSQAKSSVSFAIVRCGYRGMYDGQLHEDPYFYTNMSGAKSAGVNVGVYIYSTALSEAEAVQEASMAVAMAGKAGGCSYPIYLDMEDTVRGQSKLSTEQRMAIVNAFVSTVQSSGYKAGLYCSKNWMTARMNASAIPSSCSIWIAQYNTSCTYSGRKNIWQYSSKGSVPGIKGYVDMNKSF